MNDPKTTPVEAEHTRSVSLPVPAHRGGYPTAEQAALTEGTAVVDRPRGAILRLSGKGAVGMLDAILTNEVPKEESLGVYAALLNPKGRVRTDLRVFKDGEDVLVDTEHEGADAAREILGRYAPFSRAKVEDLSRADVPWGVLGLYGPRAKDLLGRQGLAEHETTEVEIGGATLLAVGVEVPVPGFDLLGPEDALRAAREVLSERGAVPVGPQAYEAARIAAGIPRFGADVTPENFPGESATFLGRAVSFGKGCYPGQETVARMRYRGQPNKKLYRFELGAAAEPTEPGDEIFQGEKETIGPVSKADVVGWISSVAPLPMDGRIFALGYLSRKADPGASLRAEDAKILALRPA